jgi:hypothetical protein
MLKIQKIFFEMCAAAIITSGCVDAAMMPFEMGNIIVFCSPLCSAGDDQLIVKVTRDHHVHECVLMKQLTISAIATILGRAAQENRADVVSLILKNFINDFSLYTIDFVLLHAEAYTWNSRLVRILSDREKFLEENGASLEDTPSEESDSD